MFFYVVEVYMYTLIKNMTFQFFFPLGKKFFGIFSTHLVSAYPLGLWESTGTMEERVMLFYWHNSGKSFRHLNSEAYDRFMLVTKACGVLVKIVHGG